MDEITKRQVCCLIVTYNPDTVLYELINGIIEQVDKIIIVDNKSGSKAQKDLINASHHLGLHLILNKENHGIAKALNQGISQATSWGYRWVLTFDQDSKPKSNILDIIAEAYSHHPKKNKIGAIGVNFHVNSHQKNYYKVSANALYKEKDYLITSGCLLPTDTFNKIGGFREDFFIDNVDLEYSLRIRKNNKILLITQKPGMDHKAGNPIEKKYLHFLNVISTNHNVERRYYMSRNHVILCKEYFLRFPYFILKTNYFFILSIIQLLLIEANRKAKIYAIFKGIETGIKHTIQKQNTPS